FLVNAQGEDVVAGIRTPEPLDALKTRMPVVYRKLTGIKDKLEAHYRDMQDIEFTVEEGRLYILQCRSGKRSPRAAFQMARDMAREGLITRPEAVARISAEDVERLFYPVLDPKIPAKDLEGRRLAPGSAAVPGAAVGELAFTAKDAEARARDGKRVLLVRHE